MDSNPHPEHSCIGAERRFQNAKLFVHLGKAFPREPSHCYRVIFIRWGKATNCHYNVEKEAMRRMVSILIAQIDKSSEVAQYNVP
jgi:hypothetical protein